MVEVELAAADPVTARTVIEARGARASPPSVEPHARLDTVSAPVEPSRSSKIMSLLPKNEIPEES
jgi:hypothetical protein